MTSIIQRANTTGTRIAALTAVMWLVAGPTAVVAQNDHSNYPTQQIRLIIPYAPGGATDIIFRLFANEAEKELGVSIVPVNMSGANATIGSREVRNARPDGYTLLGSHEVIAAANITGIVDYSFDAFEPVALITQTPNLATINSNLGFETLEDFRKHAVDKPGELAWGITPGGTSHYFIAMMMDSMEMPLDALRLIDYEGTGEEIMGVQRGEISGNMTNFASARAQIAEGTFRALAVAHDARLPQLPDVPTFTELGYDFVNATSRGFFAPAGTPDAIIERLAEAFRVTSESPELKARIEDELGSIIRFLPPEEQRAFFANAEERLRKLAELLDM